MWWRNRGSDIINYISEGDKFKIEILNDVLNLLYCEAIGELFINVLSMYADEVMNKIEKRNDNKIDKETITEILENNINEITQKNTW